MNALSAISWNSRSLTEYNLLVDGSLALLQSVDVFGVWETRNNAAIHHHCETHAVFCTQPKPGERNVGGTGGVIGIIAKAVASSVQFAGWHETLPLGWVTVGSIHIGFLYVRHSVTVDAHAFAEFMAQLHAEVALKQLTGAVILMGDFNGHLGQEPDASSLPRTALGDACPVGKCVMEMARRCDLVTTTGRMDAHQATHANGGRIDHVFVQTEIWTCVRECAPLPDAWHSDHLPLSMTLQPPAALPIDRAPSARAPFLRWTYSKHAHYVAAIMQQEQLWSQLRAALVAGLTSLAAALVTSIVWAAAATAGMIVDPARSSGGAHKHSRLSLSWEGQEAQALLKVLRRLGIAPDQDLRDLLRREFREAKKRRECERRERFTQYFKDKPRGWWKQFKKQAAPLVAVIKNADFEQFYLAMFAGAVPQVDTGSGAEAPPAREDLDVLMGAVSVDELVVAFNKVGTAKACGVDRLPAEFITKAASTCHDGSVLHHFAAPLATLFATVMRACSMPWEWKVKCIHPIHKKGDITAPANYRPLAVATTLYRLFTSVLAARLAPFTAPGANSVLAPMQFAFRQDMNVEQAQLPIITARDISLARKDPLVVVKLDVHKAYDTVIRALLWVALAREGIPPAFIKLLQELYTDARYIVAVNGTYTAAMVSTVGLLQGCALSPVLYSLFLKQAVLEISSMCAHLGFMAATVPYCLVNFADDLTALLASLAYVGHFMSAAELVLSKKHQTLSREKSELLVIHAVDGGRAAPVQPGDVVAGVKVVGSMKVLGVVYDQQGNLASNLDSRASKGRSKVALAMARLRAVGCQRDMHMCMLLLNVDVRQTLMFAAALWGFAGLRAEPMQHALQPVYSTLMRQALQVPCSTAHWIASLMAGQMPIQHWIVRDFYRFWNKLLSVSENNALLYGCMYVQATLALARKDCWLHKWVSALQRVRPQADARILQDFTSLQHIMVDGHDGVLDSLLHAYEDRLDGYGNPVSLQPVPHRKMALHYACMWDGRWGKRPWWHWCSVPIAVKKSWVRFTACMADIPAQALVGTVEYHARLCRKCAGGVVANEQHVVLECVATADVRQQFHPQLQWPRAMTLPAFLDRNQHKHCMLFIHAVLAAYSLAPDLVPRAP